MDNKQLIKRFEEIYGKNNEKIRLFRSPGRVNLIGEHTDYNGGFVLPAAIDMYATVVCRKRSDRKIRLAVTDLPDRVEADMNDPKSLQSFKNIRWGNYQIGVADEMSKAGYEVPGCDMLFHDTVPHGTGLSSSAAIEVATAVALYYLDAGCRDGEYGCKEPDMVQMAKISQKAENNFVGVNCGIMDQFASAMGRSGKAIFLDCRDLSFELVPIELGEHCIMISNTNKKRSLASSKYNERRRECEEGLEILRKAYPDARWLGDLTLEMFNESRSLIADPVVRKRCAHVIEENDRVLKSVKALKDNNLAEFGKLMIASHNSLRDQYEVTGIELDTMVEEALKIPEVIGSRMTGAGFGGCTVSIIRNDAVQEYIEKVGKNYLERTGLKPEFYTAGTGDGGREIKV